MSSGPLRLLLVLLASGCSLTADLSELGAEYSGPDGAGGAGGAAGDGGAAGEPGGQGGAGLLGGSAGRGGAGISGGSGQSGADPGGGGLSGSSGQGGEKGLSGGSGQGGAGEGGSSPGGAGQGGVSGGSGPGGAGQGGEAGQGGGAGDSGVFGPGGAAGGGLAGAGQGGGPGGGGGSACGDGKISGAEPCDGPLFGGATCASVLGKPATGSLSCTAECKLSTSACQYCGDGVLSEGEECDGAEFGGATCAVALGSGSVGNLSCDGGCKLVTAGCSPPSVCGNGKQEVGEGCDGEVSGVECVDVVGGSSKGVLSCDPDCFFNIEKCSIACNPLTGDGCDLAGGRICDLQYNKIACYVAPGGLGLCDACSPNFGVCGQGLHCFEYKCARFCASDSDCPGSGVCDLGWGGQGFGLCVVEGKAEASCE